MFSTSLSKYIILSLSSSNFSILILFGPYFPKIPENWNNKDLNLRWDDLKKIRDVSNISIETKRALKEIGSSLEADIKIKLNKKFYDNYKKFDFSEICITSSASVVLDKSSDKEISVDTFKAKGNKCPVCWKIKEGNCDRHNCGSRHG